MQRPMVGDDGFPRRRGGAHGRVAPGARPAAGRAAREPSPKSPQALDIARYITDMTAQLEAMAVAAHFDMLAYFLGMAKAESELLIRANPIDETPSAEAPAEEDSEQTQEGYEAGGYK